MFNVKTIVHFFLIFSHEDFSSSEKSRRSIGFRPLASDKLFSSSWTSFGGFVSSQSCSFTYCWCLEDSLVALYMFHISNKGFLSRIPNIGLLNTGVLNLTILILFKVPYSYLRMLNSWTSVLKYGSSDLSIQREILLPVSDCRCHYLVCFQ